MSIINNNQPDYGPAVPPFANRLLWEVLPEGAWRGQPAFVVGGGPSFEAVPAERLEGRLTIGINRAFERFDPTIIFGMDHEFLSWLEQGKFGQEAIEKFKLSKALKVWFIPLNIAFADDILIVPTYNGSYLQGLTAFPLTAANGIGHGNNSGYAALNLAVVLGADPIYLLGFDMRHEGQRTHWHSGYETPQTQDALDSFLSYFTYAAEGVRKAGRRVVNLCPDSALPYFEKRRWEEVLL